VSETGNGPRARSAAGRLRTAKVTSEGIAGNDDPVMRLVERLAQHLTNRRAPHFIEHDDVKESDSGGTLPDHEDLADHHQPHDDPTVPAGKLSTHCRDL